MADFFGKEISKLGVQDAYFPMFVTQGALEKEKDHIEGFSPEVAWVTKSYRSRKFASILLLYLPFQLCNFVFSGKSKLQEPLAIRPTSETIMYPAFAKWIQGHRDLPLKINQWCNVVRWEFKHPQPFLRTREFLWQEGHTAFYTREEADAEVLQILELYRRVYEDILAVPVIKGHKSTNEKFPGGLYTTTVEAFIPDSGRAIQGATSHCLGQNFAKMFKIVVEGEDKKQSYVWQNSWGLTTRSIGIMTMVHGDDNGLVLPPRVATIQTAIVPCGITSKMSPEQVACVYDAVDRVHEALVSSGVRSTKDLRDNYTPGWKFNHWELKGVPIRIELGPKDIEKNQVSVVVRHSGARMQMGVDGISLSILALLDTIHQEMLDKARKGLNDHCVLVDQWDKFGPALEAKNMVLMPWCEGVECEKAIKEKTTRKASSEDPEDDKSPSMGAKSLCIPLEQPAHSVAGKTCLSCGQPANSYTLFGRSY